MHVSALPDDSAFSLNPSDSSPTVQDRVYRHISFMLMSGCFSPGETVSLRQLSSALRVSEMPVRNALNRLTAESAIELLPNRKHRVPTLNRSQFDELTRVRTLLETDISADAYRRATRTDVKMLEGINSELLAAIEQKQTQKCIEYNQRFHMSFYLIAERPLTFSLIFNLWLRAGAFMHATLRSDSIRWRASQHEALISSLKMKNLDAAVAAIRSDINETYNEIISLPKHLIFPLDA
ncbi:MAG: GntR family transcriptional regulator [Rhizobiaceae bacterium]